MSQFVGFDALQVGQRIKTKGKPAEDDTFVAFEVSLKSLDDQTKFEGALQHIDHQNKIARVFNRDFALPTSIMVKDLQGNLTNLQKLKTGDFVKLKGKFSAATGFVPEKINMKPTMGFNVEELHGTIDEINHEKKILEVAGFTVIVHEKTTIEGF